MIGAVLSLAGGLFGGWKKWAAVGLVVVAFVGVIGFQRIQLANRAAEIARLEAIVALRDEQLTRSTGDLQEAARVNRDSAATYERDRARCQAAIAAVTADRDRLVAEAAKLRPIREKIHAEAPACRGVPAAIRSVADWLRDDPDAAGPR